MDWLKNYWGIQTGIIIIALSFAYVFIRRGFNIKTKNFSLNGNLQYIGNVIKESMRSQKKMDLNENIIRLQEQMDFTEDKIEEIYNLTMEVHLELLRKKVGLSAIENHDEVQNFGERLENILERVKTKSIKRRYKQLLIKFPASENTTFEHIELEFNKHRDYVTKVVIDEVKTSIQKRWVKNDYIQYEELAEAMAPVIAVIEQKISEAFQYAIEIQLKTHKKNCLIEKEVDEYILNLGVK